MKESIVSIVIPVYNRQELVKETLDSVLDQIYQNWECIVVDDGSTDDTWEVLESYAKKDTRIKIHKRHRAPKGAPTCRNIGAEFSQTEYLIFWDSDDIMAPWCVKERINFMIDNPELDFGLFQLLNISDDDKPSLRCHIGKVDYLKRFLSFQTTWGTPAVIWRKSFFILIDGWYENAKVWQDGEIHIRALLKEPIFAWGSIIPSGIIRFGIDKNSISTNIDEVLVILNRIAVISYIYPLLPIKNKRLLNKAILARIYVKTYHFSKANKFLIIKSAYEKGIISKSQRSNYQTIYNSYSLIKTFPILKGIYYRIFIRSKFKNYEFWKVERVENNVKDELLRKVRLLKLENAFRKQIELSFKN